MSIVCRNVVLHSKCLVAVCRQADRFSRTLKLSQVKQISVIVLCCSYIVPCVVFVCGCVLYVCEQALETDC